MADKIVVRSVVLGLIGIALASLSFAAFTDGSNDVFENVAMISVGAIAGILAKTNVDEPGYERVRRLPDDDDEEDDDGPVLQAVGPVRFQHSDEP